MASKVLLETNYTFTPSTKTLVINRYIARERILKIVNTTTHHTIYDSAQPELNLTSYTAATASAGVADSTTLVFKFNTAGSNMSSTDRLQITIDEYAERFTPAETQTDPLNKLRTSSPQALIDTDFEYGTQVSKWENLALTNLRPFAYNNGNTVTGITAISTSAGSRTITVALPSTTGITVGTPITIQDTLIPIANGVFVVDTVSANVNFTYTARSAATSTTSGAGIFDANKTVVNLGTIYTSAAIGGAPTSVTNSGSLVTVTTSVPHGLSIGNEIFVSGTTATTYAPNGSWVVYQVTSPTTFVYVVTLAPTGTIVFSSAAVYARPQGAVLHRPFDGGVIFSSNGSSNYETQIRQTRRYFRYQSGKGIQMSSGTILKPNFQADTLSYATATNLVTVKTKDQHNLQPGSTIVVTNANEAIFNGTFTVYSITGYNTFTYTPATTSATDVTASGVFYAAVVGWYGAANRLGIFDQQNGLFFEFDGQTLYAVKRNSTYQVAGRVDVTAGSTTITANALFPTTFSTQLNPGDFIVLRGQSYRVDAIASNTSLTISPAYRGTTSTAVTASKTQDFKIPQSQWNIDKMDGTGPSGYTLDLSRMQMFYIDYSWYGAGFVRWGLRGANGDVTYVHKMQNNNVNFEAYMRSGNLPGRYESTTQPPKTILGAAVAPADTTITVASTSGFPPAGTAVIKGATAYEHFNYTGTTATTFTGVTRAQSGTNVSTGLTTAVGSNLIVNSAAFTGVQIGQRVVSFTTNAVYPDGTFITAISSDAKTLTLSQALTGSTPATNISTIPMGATSATTQAYSATAPVAVELAYPTFAPTISHWGTSVIMDGRFDDDKSLLFTYGQSKVTGLVPAGTIMPTGITVQATPAATTNTINISNNVGVLVGMTVAGTGLSSNTVVTSITGTGTSTFITLSNTATTAAIATTPLTFTGASAKALMAIRVAPSVDNGVAAAFGARDLTNRMQLVLRTLDVSMLAAGNLLVTLVLNGTATGTTTTWTNAVGNAANTITSSLAQIADYAGGSNGISGGENTGGFFVTNTGTVDLSLVRDLGNSILGGGGTTSNLQVYPDGPDVATVYVTNVGTTGVALAGRLSWTEAQA